MPLALVILAPVVLNIFLVHAFMAPEGLILAVIIGLLMIYLSFFAAPYAPTIKSLFRRKPRCELELILFENTLKERFVGTGEYDTGVEVSASCRVDTKDHRASAGTSRDQRTSTHATVSVARILRRIRCDGRDVEVAGNKPHRAPVFVARIADNCSAAAPAAER